MLSLIWLTSVVIASTAAAIMLLLIPMRLLDNWLARRRAKLRAVLLEKMLTWIEDRSLEDEMARLLVAHRSIATRLFVEVLELMPGTYKQDMVRLAERCGIEHYLQKMLARGTVSSRLAAAENLAWFQSPKTRIALLAAIEDQTDNVALAAAVSLAQIGERLPVARLLQARLGHGSESSHRLEMVLVRVAPQQIDDLISVAGDRSCPERARVGAIDALAHTGFFHLVYSLSLLAEDPSPMVRAAVARALGILAYPDGSEAIAKLAADPEWKVRAEAAEAAGRSDLTTFIDQLSVLLGDENWWVRFRAGEALAALGGIGIEALRRLASSAEDRAGRMAAVVLAERDLA